MQLVYSVKHMVWNQVFLKAQAIHDSCSVSRMMFLRKHTDAVLTEPETVVSVNKRTTFSMIHVNN